MTLTAGLAGCGGLSHIKNPFAKPKTRLPGERISVLPSQIYKADPKAGPVVLPRQTESASWSQPGGSRSNSLGNLALNDTLRKAWSVRIGYGSSSRGRLTASPIVAAGRIYTLDAAGHVSAFNASNGQKLWSTSVTPKGQTRSEGYGGGLAMDSGRLYVVTGYATALALNPANGAVEWTVHLGEPVRSSPTASNGDLFFVSADAVLHCLDGATGKELWTKPGLSQPAVLLSNVSPAVAGGVVVASFPAGDVTAVQISSGKVKWNDSLSRAEDTQAAGVLVDPARPVIDRGVVYAVSHGGRMIATSESTGTRQWTQQIASTQMPWPAGSSVFVVDENDRLFALARRTGEIQWVVKLPRTERWNGPVLAGGQLWLVSAHGRVIGVNPRSGQIVTNLKLDAHVYIAPIVAGGRMYILADDATLFALQ